MDKLPLERIIDVLLELDDDYLVDMCSADTYFQGICQEDYFWELRTKKKYSPFLHLRNKSSKWKHFYRTLTRDAAYVIIEGNTVNIVNNINIVYDVILKSIVNHTHLSEDELPGIYRVDDIHKYINSYSVVPLQVYIMFNEEEIHMNDPDFLLFNLDGRRNHNNLYIHPDFSTLPPFQTSKEFIWYVSTDKGLPYWGWIGHFETLIGIGRPSKHFMERLFLYGENDSLLFDRFEIIPMNIPIRRYNFFHYENDTKAFIRADLPPIIIQEDNDQYTFLVIPEEDYSKFMTGYPDGYKVINEEVFLDVSYRLAETLPSFPIDSRTIFPSLKLGVNDVLDYI